MCFTASVSFTLGSALVIVGLACVAIASRSNKKWMGIALFPFFSGIQQIIEGIVWIQLNSGNVKSAHFYSYLYLFFAYTLWPTYIPLSVYLLEPEVRRKKIILGFIIVGLITSAAIYVPILTGAVAFTTLIQSHSIHYLLNVSSLTIWTYSICYAETVILPLLICSIPRVKVFGLMMLVSLLAAYWWYIYVFTSVWCFFAAIGSLYILFLIYKLPKH